MFFFFFEGFIVVLLLVLFIKKLYLYKLVMDREKIRGISIY